MQIYSSFQNVWAAKWISLRTMLAVAEGGGAGRDPGPCKEMPLPCKYLIEVIQIFSSPPNL